ncbi:hypothetical protein BDW71DRAFT_212676 [Aspergillus fruticulosus]
MSTTSIRTFIVRAPLRVDEAKETVRKALEALAVVNKLRMENINSNTYEFAAHRAASGDAPPLGIDSLPTEEGAKKRSADSGSFVYSTLEELREAARIVAGSSPPAIPEGDHEQVAANIRRKYALDINDTNVPQQALLHWDVHGASTFAHTDNIYPSTSAETEDVAKQATNSTIYPAVVYFPPGTYLVSSSIIQYYNTQFLGDPITVLTILAAPSFIGLGVITSDVYVSDGTQCGGFLSDLTFVGGDFGAFFGNQQFTTGHLVFVNCDTALQIHWDWAWTMQDIVIESCETGIVIVCGAGGAMSDGQPVGSHLVPCARITPGLITCRPYVTTSHI